MPLLSQDGVLCSFLYLEGCKEFSVVFCLLLFQTTSDFQRPFILQSIPIDLLFCRLCDWLSVSCPDLELILIIPLSSSSYLTIYFQIYLGMPFYKTPYGAHCVWLYITAKQSALAEKLANKYRLLLIKQ